MDAAMEAALRLLEYRARSRHELTQRLQRKGAAPALVEGVLERLGAQGLVDDDAFARQWAESRLRTGHGRRRIALELRLKGIATGTIRETLAAVADPAQEAEVACAQARRRLRGWRRLPPVAQRRRLYGLLQRRGYAADVIEEVLKRLVRDDGD